MKKSKKIIISIIFGIISLLIIDFISIFIINRPLLAIKRENIYIGILYDVYNCDEYPMVQIKRKGTKFSCAINNLEYNVIDIVDKTKSIENFFCAEALEQFFEDEKYEYYYNCIKSEYVIVKYENGLEETVTKALKKSIIKISDLDTYGIKYIKMEKTND